LDDSMSSTMTGAQMMHHFINSPPLIIQNHGWTCPMFSSAVDVDGCPEHSSLVTLVRPFLNMVIHSYMLFCGKELFPYCAESLRLVSALGTPSAQRNCITALPC
jgi:hypothetical protein